MNKIVSFLFILALLLLNSGCGGAGAGNSTGLSITTDSFPWGNLNRPYSARLEAAGGKSPYSWSIEEGQLPDGLTLNETTGEISGTPTAVNFFEFKVSVRDASGNKKSKILAIKVGVEMTVRAEITVVTSDWLTTAEYDLVVSIWAEYSNTTSTQRVRLTSSPSPINLSLVTTKLVDEGEVVIIKAEIVPPATINGGVTTSKTLFISNAFVLRTLQEGDKTIDVWPGQTGYSTTVHYKLSAEDVP